MNKLIDIFCDVDDFCHQFLPVWEAELIANAKGITKGCQVLSFAIEIILLTRV
jgi:hypothetical protein